MPVMGRAYVLLVVIVFATMATRIGWIDWTLIGTWAAKLAIGVFVFLTLAALLIGLPSVLMIRFATWVLTPSPAAAARSVEPLR